MPRRDSTESAAAFFGLGDSTESAAAFFGLGDSTESAAAFFGLDARYRGLVLNFRFISALELRLVRIEGQHRGRSALEDIQMATKKAVVHPIAVEYERIMQQGEAVKRRYRGGGEPVEARPRRWVGRGARSPIPRAPARARTRCPHLR